MKTKSNYLQVVPLYFAVELANDPISPPPDPHPVEFA